MNTTFYQQFKLPMTKSLVNNMFNQYQFLPITFSFTCDLKVVFRKSRVESSRVGHLTQLDSTRLEFIKNVFLDYLVIQSSDLNDLFFILQASASSTKQKNNHPNSITGCRNNQEKRFWDFFFLKNFSQFDWLCILQILFESTRSELYNGL